jgi:hypothetical protein
MIITRFLLSSIIINQGEEGNKHVYESFDKQYAKVASSWRLAGAA